MEETYENHIDTNKFLPVFIRFTDKQTPESCLRAVKRDGCILVYIKEQTPEN